MHIETIVVGEFGVNCYIGIGSDAQALVVDPGEDAEAIIDYLHAHHLTVAAYLLTHGHCDHIFALARVHDRFPAPVAMHPDDRTWAFTAANTLPPFFTEVPSQPDAPAIDLIEGQTYRFAERPFSILHTPGHTPGGVCIYFEDDETLITGDTLFAGSVGRTDLQGGNSRTLMTSLKALKALPDATRILPGHGPASTIGQERKTNYFMQG